MMYSAGDLGLVIDFGSNEPGAVLQRQEDGNWHDYVVDGEPVTNPFDMNTISPAGIDCGLHKRRKPIIAACIFLGKESRDLSGSLPQNSGSMT